MRKSRIDIIIAVAFLLIPWFWTSCDKDKKYVDTAMLRELDSLVADNRSYVVAKENRIAALRVQLADARGHEAYNLAGEIHLQYSNYNLDSARTYAMRKLSYASDPIEADRAKLNCAKTEIAMGLHDEAYRRILEIVADTVNPLIKKRYFDFMAVDAEDRGRNPLFWLRKIDSMSRAAGTRSVFVEANIARHSGDYKKAIAILKPLTEDTTMHSRAIARFITGQCNLAAGDTATAIDNLAFSAIEDLKTPVRDYRSLLLLADVLFKQGDSERAYSYMKLAARDYNSSRSTNNMLLVNAIMPSILHEHELEEARSDRNARVILVGICLLVLALAVLLWLAIRGRHRMAKMVKMEKQLNAEVSKANKNLESTNEKLRESDRMKNAYITQYLTLCSQYLDALDTFRGKVSAAARTKGLPGVEQVLAKADDTKALKSFYSDFDVTFLMLFPNFIEDFNKLVNEEAHLRPGRDGSLSSETRVFALIRLGITDSVRIAAFLRRSVTTVYNIRVKMRNASLISREDFESTVATL